MPVTIFFCYAREDEALLKQLQSHLRPLQRQGLIEVWYDGDISAGAKWEEAIEEHLNIAQIVLLLVSPAFMDSDYCYGVEMKRALERHERGEATVIPIILRPVYWYGEMLGKLEVLPTDGKPVTDPDWHSLDRALYDVAQGIYRVIRQLTAQQVSALPYVSKGEGQKTVKANDTPLPVQRRRRVSPFIPPHALEKPVLLHTLIGHKAIVLCVAISADGQTLVSGSSDRTIKAWNLSTGQEIHTFSGLTDTVKCLAISPDGQTIISGCKDQTIKVWNLSTGQEVYNLVHKGSAVRCVAVCTDGQLLASGGRDQTIKVWNLSTGQEVRMLTTSHKGYRHKGYPVRCTAISPHGQLLAGGAMNNSVKVWDLSTGQEVHTLTGHKAAVLCIAISADGQTLVSGSEDMTIKVWDLSIGQEIHTLTGHTHSILSVAISPDKQALVSGSEDNTVKIWYLPTGQNLHTITDFKGATRSVAIDSGGRTFASGSEDKTIKVWNLPTGEKVQTTHKL